MSPHTARACLKLPAKIFTNKLKSNSKWIPVVFLKTFTTMPSVPPLLVQSLALELHVQQQKKRLHPDSSDLLGIDCLSAHCLKTLGQSV